MKGAVALYGAFQWLAAGVLNLVGGFFKITQAVGWLTDKLGITKNQTKIFADMASTAFLASEESARKAVDAFSSLTLSAEKTANASKVVAGAKTREAEAMELAIQKTERQSEAYRRYYSELTDLHETAIDKMEAKSKELLQVEREIRQTRMTTQDLILQVQQKTMTAEEKYYSTAGSLEDKYSMAMKLSGDEKIRLLGSIQSKWASISSEVKEGDAVVISSSEAQAEALNKIKQIGDDLIEAQNEKRAGAEAEIKTWDKVKESALSAMDLIKDKIAELPAEKKFKIDADEALRTVREVQRKIDEIPDITRKKVIVEAYTKASPVRPFSEGIDYMMERLDSLSGSGEFTVDMSNITSMINAYAGVAGQLSGIVNPLSPTHPHYGLVNQQIRAWFIISGEIEICHSECSSGAAPPSMIEETILCVIPNECEESFRSLNR